MIRFHTQFHVYFLFNILNTLNPYQNGRKGFSNFNFSCLDISSEGCASSFSVYSTILKNIFSSKRISYSQIYYEDKCTYLEIFAYLEESTPNSNIALGDIQKGYPSFG